jgi:hypothetical protein
MTHARYAALAVILSGCFAPAFDNPACGTDGSCPDGMSCVAQVCELADEPGDDPKGDNPADPDLEETPTNLDDCYREAAGVEGATDPNDDTRPEATDLEVTAGGEIVRICGTMADRSPASGLIDRDVFTLRTSAAAFVAVIVRISSPDGGQYDEMLLHVDRQVNGMFDGLAELTAGSTRGEIEIGVDAFNPLTLGDEVPYVIEIEPIKAADLCAVVPGAANYTEARDTAANSNAANDVFTNLFDAFVVTPAADAPEPTNLVVNAGGRVKLAGVAALNGNQPDDYRDRDTFQFRTGPDTRRLTFQLRWAEDPATAADNGDLDFFLTDPARSFGHRGANDSFDGVEFNATEVDPDTTYLFVVANFNISRVAKPYEVVICASSR